MGTLRKTSKITYNIKVEYWTGAIELHACCNRCAYSTSIDIYTPDRLRVQESGGFGIRCSICSVMLLTAATLQILESYCILDPDLSSLHRSHTGGLNAEAYQKIKEAFQSILSNTYNQF